MMTEAMHDADPAVRFDRLRIVGALMLAIAGGLASLLGAWPLALGIALGGVIALGWAGQLVRKVLARPLTDRIKAQVADRGTFTIRAIMGTIPPAIIGVVVLLIGLKYPVAFVPAGVFLAMALTFLLMYMAIWSAR